MSQFFAARGGGLPSLQMLGVRGGIFTAETEMPDWEYFLPDEGETYPEPGDFWLEDDPEEEP